MNLDENNQFKEFLKNHKFKTTKDLCDSSGCYFIGWSYDRDHIWFKCSRCGKMRREDNTPMTI